MLDGDEDRVEENQDDDEPVERLTFDQMPNSYSTPHTSADDFPSFKLNSVIADKNVAVQNGA